LIPTTATQVEDHVGRMGGKNRRDAVRGFDGKVAVSHVRMGDAGGIQHARQSRPQHAGRPEDERFHAVLLR